MNTEESYLEMCERASFEEVVRATTLYILLHLIETKSEKGSK